MACLMAGSAALGAEIGTPMLGKDVVPAPEGYDRPDGPYKAVRATDLYISPYIWAGKVSGIHVNAGQGITALGKPKGYDWLLVGKDGVGIGYLPMSSVTQKK